MRGRRCTTWLGIIGVATLAVACSSGGPGSMTGPPASKADPSAPTHALHVAKAAAATVTCNGFQLAVSFSDLTVGQTYTVDYHFTLTPTGGGSTLTLPTGGGTYTFTAAVPAPTVTIKGNWSLGADYTVTGSATLTTTIPITFNGSSSASLDCATRHCTLTQGFYKNHESVVASLLTKSSVYTSGGTLLIGGTGLTADEIITNLETPPQGSSVLILEHQLIAAELNIIAGASAPANVIAAITQANTLLAADEGSTTLADLLDRYNSGQTGPGECH